MIVYKIINNINGKIYIGQTIQRLKNRINQHISNAKRNRKQGSALYCAMRKYGIENFSITEIGTYSSREELNAAEIYFIQIYNCISPNGYNLTFGGDSGIKSSSANKKSSMGMKNKKHKIETKIKMSDAHKGKKHSEEHRKKVSEAKMGNKNPRFGKVPWNKGISPSEETRKKLSEAAIKYYLSIKQI